MQLPGAPDPKDALQKIADELKAKFDEAGMGKVEEFTDSLDDIKDMASKGPEEALNKMKGLFNEFKSKLEEIMADPSSLAPPGIAACASWYGNAAVGKLKDISKEAEDFVKSIGEMVGPLQDAMKKLKETIENAMKSLEGTVKKLAKLPKELQQTAGNVSGAEDVGKIDTDTMKKCTDVSAISGPLDSLAGLKGVLGDAIAGVKKGLDALVDFIESLPNKVTACFEVPSPLCFMTGALMSQAPPAMKSLLDQVKGMKSLDLSPMVSSLDKVKGNICELDVETVKAPVEKFADMAKEKLGDLDKVVSGAKLASGGAAGAVGGLAKMW